MVAKGAVTVRWLRRWERSLRTSRRSQPPTTGSSPANRRRGNRRDPHGTRARRLRDAGVGRGVPTGPDHLTRAAGPGAWKNHHHRGLCTLPAACAAFALISAVAQTSILDFDATRPAARDRALRAWQRPPQSPQPPRSCRAAPRGFRDPAFAPTLLVVGELDHDVLAKPTCGSAAGSEVVSPGGSPGTRSNARQVELSGRSMPRCSRSTSRRC